MISWGYRQSKLVMGGPGGVSIAMLDDRVSKVITPPKKGPNPHISYMANYYWKLRSTIFHQKFQSW